MSATAVRNITVRFGGDPRGLNAAARSSQTALSRFADKARQVAKIVSVAAVASAAAYAKGAIQIASDTSEALSKTRTVFGQAAKDVEAFAATSAKSHGMSRLEALKYVSAMGAIGVAQGQSQATAAALSLEYTQLAADMASFSNTTVEAAAAALTASMTGEYEQLKKYGVAINDARLATEAQRLGLEKTGPTWTAAQKQLLSYNLLTRDTKLQQGDFTRTSDGAANSAKILTAQLNDMQGVIGEKLLPVQVQFLQSMIDAVDWVTENERSIKEWAEVLGWATTVLGSIYLAVKAYSAAVAVATFVTTGWIGAVWALNFAFRHHPIGLVISALVLLGIAFVAAWKKSETFRKIVIGAFNAMVGGAGAAIKGLVSAVGWWVDSVLGRVQMILEGLAHLPDWLGGGRANDAAEAIQRLRDNVAAGVDAINAEIDRIVDEVKITVRMSFEDSINPNVVGQGAAMRNEATADKAWQRANAEAAKAARARVNTEVSNIPSMLSGGAFGAAGAPKLGGGGALKSPKAPKEKVKKEARKTAQEILDAFLSGLASRFPHVEERLQKFSDGIAVKLGHGLDAVVAAAEERLAALSKAREATAKRIGKATETLKNARATLRDYAANIRGTINALGDLGTHGGGMFEVVRDRLAQTVANAKDFAATMTRLAAAGLSDTAIQQLIAAGPGMATATGKAILEGGSEGIAQIKGMQAELDRVATETGARQADQFYAAGVTQAEGVLEGLKSKDAQLKKQMREVGNALVEAVQAGLRVKVTDGGLRRVKAGVSGGRAWLAEETPGLSTPRTSSVRAGDGGGDTAVHIHATGPTLQDIVRVEIRESNRRVRTAALAGARRS